jgi:hypothetical protein
MASIAQEVFACNTGRLLQNQYSRQAHRQLPSNGRQCRKTRSGAIMAWGMRPNGIHCFSGWTVGCRRSRRPSCGSRGGSSSLQMSAAQRLNVLKRDHLDKCCKDGNGMKCMSRPSILSWHWWACEFCSRSFLPRPVKETGLPMDTFTRKFATGLPQLLLRSWCTFILIRRQWQQLLVMTS